jgi:hypothetical protein
LFDTATTLQTQTDAVIQYDSYKPYDVREWNPMLLIVSTTQAIFNAFTVPICLV